MGTAPPEALGLRFKVHVDNVAGVMIGDLGDWQKCEGLSVEFDIFEYKEGGENGYVHRLPGRAKYQNVKLTRPITPESTTVAKWVATVLSSKAVTTASVIVLDASGQEVAHWNLTGVYPARWTGPTLDVTASAVATEVLEMSHNGFMVG